MRRGCRAVLLAAATAAGLAGCTQWDAQPEYNSVFNPTGRGTGGPVREVPPQVTVKRGDTVYGIARTYGVPMRQLMEMNRLAPPYTLYVGQVLRMPAQQVYVVQPGDTLYGISRAHAVDMNALARTNRLGPPYVITQGQRLVLPGTVQAMAADRAEPEPRPPVLVEKSDPGSTSAAPAPPVVAQGPATPAPTTAPPPPATTAPTAPAEPPKVATAPAKPAPVGEPPARSGGRFAWPVKGPVIAGFGPAGKGLHNDGVNILVPEGTPVKAAENGVVVYAGNELKGFGNLLLLKHDGGWMTAYAHNSQLIAQRGATVKKGEVIAKSGASGNVDRPQVHFELRKGSKAVDPVKYLDGSADLAAR